MRELNKNFNPSEYEDKIYRMWEEGGYFQPSPGKMADSFCIVLPPPNITGKLHMGHALDHSIQDVLIRYKRMQGYETLWQPGTDHASIATEAKVVEKIREEEGRSKEEVGRDGFLERAWAWKEEYGDNIVEQMKKLGDSCDWERERFTMDEGCNRAVTEFFVDLYENGYIYRGDRIINWCIDCKTSLSDAEVEHKEENGKFYYFKYPFKDSDEYLEVATTRPETILGDTAVAVHPEDERYEHLVGKTLIVPVIGREIPLIADEYVEMDFGTGVVKITPAHDPNDFEVGLRHEIDSITVMNEDGTMNQNAGKYMGMTREACRIAILEDLKKEDLLIESKDRIHNVGHCYRCDTTVEPMLSKQWFVRMQELAKPAIDAIQSGELEFVPKQFEKTYLNWLLNIRDWCISRQLWWGHRIPAYYCTETGEVVVSRTRPSDDENHHYVQDEDVLDTWFSSGLWPLSTLGWPEEENDLDRFFPTDVLVTGYDIIFFWVIRMVFSSYYLKQKSPFQHVLIHGLVRDAEGQKMSKSLGNGIDPLDIIDLYGADALRFTLLRGNAPGSDMRFSEKSVEPYRNFANKIWNASRFILMNRKDRDMNLLRQVDTTGRLSPADKWILSELNEVVREVHENLDKFEIGLAADKIYHFAWSSFCDWYIELVKKRLFDDSGSQEDKDVVLHVLLTVLEDILKLLHPFMPFITEEIYSYLEQDGPIIVAPFPEYSEKRVDAEATQHMEFMMEMIRQIRNLRSQVQALPNRKTRILLHVHDRNDEIAMILKTNKDYILTLGYGVDLEFVEEASIPDDTVSAVMDRVTVYLPMAELVNYEKELERLQKEKTKFESEVMRAEKKLSNEGFLSKAPQKLIDEEKNKKIKFEEMLGNVQERIADLQMKLAK